VNGRAILALFAAGSLAACNVGPDYRKPGIAMPSAFGEPHPTLPVAAQLDLSKWWEAFHDPELDSLIARALQANLDLQTAASRVREAREQEIVAGAAEWPSLSAYGTGFNMHSNSSPLSAGTAPATPANIKLYSAGFDATWEIDLFGGTRRAVEAAKANTEASLWEMHDAEVTLSAEVAYDYLNLRAAQARIALLQSELKDEQQLFDLVRARRQNGFVTELDVDQQRTLLENVQAQIPELDAEARAMIHALAVLLAEPPEAMDGELTSAETIPVAPPVLPPALPADLLRRRPDIREAERKLAAATAQEGVAIADLYPKLDLIGATSFTGSTLSGLFSSRNFGTVGIGFIDWPIFEAGKTRANIRASKEAELQAYFAWRKTVLGALQEVEDALARFTDEEQHERALAETETAAASSETIARQQYVSGLVPFINVLSAETTLTTARDQLVQSRQALAQDLAAIYKALGGGWDETSVNWKIRPSDPENG
jgi:outer membrane protein, multidrug efflux system